MQLHCSPRQQIVYDQLRLVDRRRLRIQSSVIAAFPKFQLRDYIRETCPNLRGFEFNERLDDAMDDTGPAAFLKSLAFQIETNEARLVEAFFRHPSIPSEDMEKVVLESAQVAGQDAARDYLRGAKRLGKFGSISMLDLYSILHRLVFFEMPDTRSAFPSIRPLSDISIHYQNCVHMEAWKKASVDPKIMSKIERTWIQGILDVIRPDITLTRINSIANGDAYGRDRFLPTTKNVSI